MPAFLNVACIQMNATPDAVHNLKRAEALAATALRRGARLIAFPENFYWRGSSRDLPKIAAATPRVIRHFQNLARRHRAIFLLGSLLEKSSVRNKYYNTAILISEKGRIAARYRKIHLFGIGMDKIRTDESRHIQPGRRVVLGKIFGVPAGLTICYDLRFPELFRQLTHRGVRLLFVPANFTEVTGKAHWEVLLRARAIENQAFVVAPAQVGKNTATKIRSFGTSLIIDPWGKVLARGSRTKEEVLTARLDFSRQKRLRKSFPVLQHRRL